MTDPSFRIHDTSDFPLIRYRLEAMQPGYGPAWCAEMDALVGGDRAYVMIFPEGRREEEHEDRKLRGQWLKRNKDALARTCLGLIVVEPDAERRAALEIQFPQLRKAFGAPQMAAASQIEAEIVGRRLLAGEAAED